MNNNDVYITQQYDASPRVSNVLSSSSTGKPTLLVYVSVSVYSLLIISLTTVSLYGDNSKSLCNDTFAFLLHCYRLYALLTLSLVLSTRVISFPYYSVIATVLQIIYHILVVYSYIIVRDNYTYKCLHTQTYRNSTIVIFMIIGIGVIDIIRYISFIVELICVFPNFIQLFLRNPTQSIAQHRIDGTIVINNQPL